MIDAEEAQRLGMVNRIVPLAESPAATLKFARRLALISPEALYASKLAISRGADVAGFATPCRPGWTWWRRCTRQRARWAGVHRHDPQAWTAGRAEMAARSIRRDRTRGMNVLAGCIDCDIHPSLPGLRALSPYLPASWQETFAVRGMHELVPNLYPPAAPLTVRPDWQPQAGPPAQLQQIRDHVLDHFETRLAICNCLYGMQLLFSEDMAAAIARAMNEWMARELLDREPRLRASIVVPMQNTEMAVEEIERWAPDHRFVQVLVLAMGDMPLGRRAYGRSMPRLSGMACRSVSTPAATITIRQRRPAGRPIIARITSIRRRDFRRSLAALSMKVCSSSSRHCAWC